MFRIESSIPHQTNSIKAQESSSPSLWFMLFPPLYLVMLIISAFSSSKTTDDYKDRAENYSAGRGYSSTAQKTGKTAIRKRRSAPITDPTRVSQSPRSQATSSKISNEETKAIQHAKTAKGRVLNETKVLDEQGVLAENQLAPLEKWAVEVMQWMLEKANYDSVHTVLSSTVEDFADKLATRREFLRLKEATGTVEKMTKKAKTVKDTDYKAADFDRVLAKLQDETKSFSTLDTNVKGSKDVIQNYKSAVESFLKQIDRLTGNSEKAAPFRKEVKRVATKSAPKVDLKSNPMLIAKKFQTKFDSMGRTNNLIQEFKAEAKRVHQMNRGPLMRIARSLGVDLSKI